MHSVTYLLLVLIVIAAPVSQCSLSLRGVHPDALVRYQSSSGKFTCFDGSKTISFDQVNDNFCDCHDGSDEPGTSACPTSTFYCQNRGFEPKTLASSFVDDGVCDCCDGTDEPAGKCKNTCFEASASTRQALKDKANDIISAVNMKDDLVKEAAKAKEDARVRLSTIDPEIDAQDDEVAKLQEEVNLLEEQKRKADEEAEAAATAAAAEAAAQEAAQAAAQAQAEGESQETAAPAEGEGAESAAGAPAEGEESAEDLGRRIASQWTHDPEAAQTEHDEHQPLEVDTEFFDDDHHHHDWDNHYVPEPKTPLEEAQEKLREATQKATALKDEKERLQKHLQLDVGPGDMFWHLAGKCFSASDPRFTYEACFFDKATQTEGHSTTNLGGWEGFKDDYKVALFSNGDWCWEAPNRSLRIELECGREVKLHSPAEPEKCVYTAKLTTPTACQPEMAKVWQEQVARLEALEAEFLAEQAAQQQPVHDEL